MKQPLVVYTTRTGHSRMLAEKLGTLLGAPVHEVIDLVNRKGFFGFIFSGFQAVSKKATPIREAEINLSNYDGVVIVVPVWASNLTPPMRTWLQNHKRDLAGKPIAVLGSCKGSDPQTYANNIKEEFPPVKACSVCLEKESNVDDFLKKWTQELTVL